ncbi:hypothetical protein PQR72_31325 [Paraburkholderia madseniana]|uniref:hypothetical protein n=1 Tax=Paraburkholderia madseniana TaxID=2599607 RepID=UPI001F20DFCD|nr:hypothetical protein [Paraburkholderia madseniana]
MIFERVPETCLVVLPPPHIIRNPYEAIDRCRFARLVIGLIWRVQQPNPPATGVTVALPQQHGIRVFAESQIAELAAGIERESSK